MPLIGTTYKNHLFKKYFWKQQDHAQALLNKRRTCTYLDLKEKWGYNNDSYGSTRVLNTAFRSGDKAAPRAA